MAVDAAPAQPSLGLGVERTAGSGPSPGVPSAAERGMYRVVRRSEQSDSSPSEFLELPEEAEQPDRGGQADQKGCLEQANQPGHPDPPGRPAQLDPSASPGNPASREDLREETPKTIARTLYLPSNIVRLKREEAEALSSLLLPGDIINIKGQEYALVRAADARQAFLEVEQAAARLAVEESFSAVKAEKARKLLKACLPSFLNVRYVKVCTVSSPLVACIGRPGAGAMIFMVRPRAALALHMQGLADSYKHSSVFVRDVAEVSPYTPGNGWVREFGLVHPHPELAIPGLDPSVYPPQILDQGYSLVLGRGAFRPTTFSFSPTDVLRQDGGRGAKTPFLDDYQDILSLITGMDKRDVMREIRAFCQGNRSAARGRGQDGAQEQERGQAKTREEQVACMSAHARAAILRIEELQREAITRDGVSIVSAQHVRIVFENASVEVLVLLNYFNVEDLCELRVLALAGGRSVALFNVNLGNDLLGDPCFNTSEMRVKYLPGEVMAAAGCVWGGFPARSQAKGRAVSQAKGEGGRSRVRAGSKANDGDRDRDKGVKDDQQGAPVDAAGDFPGSALADSLGAPPGNDPSSPSSNRPNSQDFALLAELVGQGMVIMYTTDTGEVYTGRLRDLAQWTPNRPRPIRRYELDLAAEEVHIDSVEAGEQALSLYRPSGTVIVPGAFGRPTELSFHAAADGARGQTSSLVLWHWRNPPGSEALLFRLHPVPDPRAMAKTASAVSAATAAAGARAGTAPGLISAPSAQAPATGPTTGPATGRRASSVPIRTGGAQQRTQAEQGRLRAGAGAVKPTGAPAGATFPAFSPLTPPAAFPECQAYPLILAFSYRSVTAGKTCCKVSCLNLASDEMREVYTNVFDGSPMTAMTVVGDMALLSSPMRGELTAVGLLPPRSEGASGDDGDLPPLLRDASLGREKPPEYLEDSSRPRDWGAMAPGSNYCTYPSVLPGIDIFRLFPDRAHVLVASRRSPSAACYSLSNLRCPKFTFPSPNASPYADCSIRPDGGRLAILWGRCLVVYKLMEARYDVLNVAMLGFDTVCIHWVGEHLRVWSAHTMFEILVQ